MERKDVLSGLFFMLAVGLYVSYVRHPFSLVRYLAVMVCLVMELMAKPMLVTLSAVLLLLDYWPLGRFAGGRRLPGNQAEFVDRKEMLHDEATSSFPWRPSAKPWPCKATTRLRRRPCGLGSRATKPHGPTVRHGPLRPPCRPSRDAAG